MTTILWFRQDLRLSDNPALCHAAANGPVIPVYIRDETDPLPLGGASLWWLHHSLAALRDDLGGMVFLSGDPLECLSRLAVETGAKAIVWNRTYEPHAVKRDKAIKAALKEKGLDVRSFKAGLLHEPWEVETGAGDPYKVFTPFWRAAREKPVGETLARPDAEVEIPKGIGDDLDDWALLPENPDWAAGWDDTWTPGEAGARKRFDAFLDDGLNGYAKLRDRPDQENVSRLSPHLHFGEISPRQIHNRVRFLADREPAVSRDADKFLAELGWREFSHHLLFHFPTLPTENWRPSFDAYPWRDDAAQLKAWQRGRTGYPIVDAGMRELWQTGYMHNRVRMIVASFLIKHLRMHWRHGEAWFRDTLVDADLANNAAGWQWVAGSGADAAPYFRIFNPMTQGRKFDPEGAYVRRWCPELAGLPDEHIHAPFEAPASILDEAGVVLGETYPKPLVDHAKARAAALEGYEKVKSSAQ